MKQKLLSVIVPVYNVEHVLERCIKSLVNQTYRELEIILIDDASTDNSRKICMEWVSRDSRIILVESSKNKGLAETRNVGIQIAQGDYLTFVDSDDFLEHTAYQRMIEVIEKDKSDFVICNFWNYKENSNKKVIAYQNIINTTEPKAVLKELLLEHLPTSAWCKVLKREVMIPLDKTPLWFPKGRRYEDTVIAFRQVLSSSKISIIESPLYYYVQSDNTITAKPKLEDIEDIIQNINEIRSLLHGECSDELIECYITSTLIYALQLLYKIDGKIQCHKKQLFSELSKSIKKIPLRMIFMSKKKYKLILCKFRMIDLILRRY